MEPPEAFFNETLRDSAEISGAIIVGLQLRGKQTGSRGLDPKLSGLVPGDPVCLRLISANGLYDAINTFTYRDGGAAESPMIDITALTRHGQFLGELEEDEIAAAVSKGECGEPSEGYYPVSWGVAEADTARLFLNSFRADTVVARFEETNEVVRCAPVEVEVRSAYDTACDLPILGRSGEVTVEIVRFVNRQPAPSDFVTLILPGG